MSTHHNLADCIAVDGHRHRLAHTHVGQWVLAIDIIGFDIIGAHVHSEENHTVLRRLFNHKPIGIVDALKVLDGHVLKEIDLTRQQRRNAGRCVLDRSVNDFRHFHRELVNAPVIVVLHHDGLHVRFPALQHVRTGAIGICGSKSDLATFKVLHVGSVVRFGPTLVHNEKVGEVGRQNRVRTIGYHFNGVIIHRTHFGD